MAIPLIQIGQCGNQIGQAFYNAMFAQAQQATPAHQALSHSFFQDSSHAKAVLIDMEPKVVNKCLSQKASWSYDSRLSLVREEGSGNNWAYGCCVHGPKVREEIVEVLRRVSEPQDYINSFVQVQSLAGGTGSGLGTYNFTLLDEIFPKIPKLVVCVLPHLSGEVILQSYNATLSLGTVCDLADGVFLVENDQVNDVCIKQMNVKKPQLEEMNRVIARSLASMMFPVVRRDVSSLHSLEENSFNFAKQMTEEVFYDNRYKIASIRCAPYSEQHYENSKSDLWQSIENQLEQRAKPYKSRLFIGRGIDVPQKDKERKARALYDKHSFMGFNRSGTMIENGQGSVGSLETMLERAYGMVKERAFMYQYEKYGVGVQTFTEYLGAMEQIQSNYSKLR